jgi:hypothetical protein
MIGILLRNVIWRASMREPRNYLCNGTTVCQGPRRTISHRSVERCVAFRLRLRLKGG